MSDFGSLFLIDSRDLESFFSNEHSLSELPTVWDDLQEESFADLARVKELLSLLPPREADFIDLYFFKRVRQTSIAEIFNVSQPTVCYRLRRATVRLRLLLDLSLHSAEQIEKDLSSLLKDPTDVRIMLGMLRTTCQSDVARELNVTQGFVRHRFLRTLSLLEKREEYQKYAQLFSKIRDNINVLKNTNRSSWSEDVIYLLG